MIKEETMKRIEERCKNENLKIIRFEIRIKDKRREKYIHAMDIDGYKYCQRTQHFAKGLKTSKTWSNGIYSIENIKLFIDKNFDIKSEIISEEYKNRSTKIKFKCSECGEVFEKSFNTISLLRTDRLVCRKCINKQILKETHALGDDFIIKSIQDAGYEILEHKENVKATTKFKVKNKDGYLGLIEYRNIRECQDFYIVSSHNPFSINNIKLFLLKNNLNIALLSDSYINHRVDMKWLCPCGREFNMAWVDVQSKKDSVCQCPVCSKSISSIELATLNYLDNIEVYYKHQYPIDSPFSNMKLYFDFYIPKYNKILEIEGKQHFEFSKHWHIDKDGFNKSKKYDEYKTEWCKKNNIPLLRIPYWEFKTENYKKIIMDFLEKNIEKKSGD